MAKTKTTRISLTVDDETLEVIERESACESRSRPKTARFLLAGAAKIFDRKRHGGLSQFAEAAQLINQAAIELHPAELRERSTAALSALEATIEELQTARRELRRTLEAEAEEARILKARQIKKKKMNLRVVR